MRDEGIDGPVYGFQICTVREGSDWHVYPGLTKIGHLVLALLWVSQNRNTVQHLVRYCGGGLAAITGGPGIPDNLCLSGKTGPAEAFEIKCAHTTDVVGHVGAQQLLSVS